MHCMRTVRSPVVGLLLLAAVACSESGKQTDQPGGTGAGATVVDYPLDGPLPSGFRMQQSVGSRFTNGMLIVFNRGAADLEIVRVAPRMKGKGLRFLGALVAGQDRETGSIQTLPTWPPTATELGQLERAAGAVLPAGSQHAEKGVEVLLGYELVSPGRWAVSAVDVTYKEVGGTKTKTASFVSTMAVCDDSIDDCAMEMQQ